jgi:hypothetical protein
VYLGVRLTAEELASPRIRARLDRMHATAIIDATVARDSATPIRLLVAREIDVGNGGWGQGRAFRPLRAQADVISSTDLMAKTAGVKMREFVPERRFDAFDQLLARRRGQRLVQADHVIRPESVPHGLRDRAVYVLDGRGRDAIQVEEALVDFQIELRQDGLTSGPLSELR